MNLTDFSFLRNAAAGTCSVPDAAVCAAHATLLVDRAGPRVWGLCTGLAACFLPGRQWLEVSRCLPMQWQPLPRGQEYQALTATHEPGLVSGSGFCTLTCLGLLGKTHVCTGHTQERALGQPVLAAFGEATLTGPPDGPQRTPCPGTGRTSPRSLHDFCELSACVFGPLPPQILQMPPAVLVDDYIQAEVIVVCALGLESSFFLLTLRDIKIQTHP